MILLRILLIIAIIAVVTSMASYCKEQDRYISYLEKKFENKDETSQK